MQFLTTTLALFSALSTGAFAANVFSSFLDANGAQIGTTNFDVSNGGCFSVGRASQISFSQSGPAENANGPYCLIAYDAGGCPGNGDYDQEFRDVSLDSSRTYQLAQGLNGAGSYRWIPFSCDP
jgi:hypothetical protein